MNINQNLLNLIGNTPIIKITKLRSGVCDLYVKLENQNPGGSIKDRIAVYMIKDAEQQGKLRPGGTIIEATAGNTGLGLALVAAARDYKMICVIPDKMSLAKINHLKAMGVQIVLTRSDVEKGHPEYYQDLAENLSKDIPNSYYINQFGNPINPKAHYEWTGPEIWQQMDHNLDAIVCGVGTGGTLTGVGKYMQEVCPNVEMILADPKGSILAPLINTGEKIKPGRWLVEGIGEDFIPSICDISLVKKAYIISDKEAFNTARELLKYEGIYSGSSSGVLVAAALKYCQAQTRPKRVLTFICDGGAKYQDKMYNDDWLKEKEQLGLL
ncbi:MAG: cysteine synthase family protein [Gammaproteobacteria bacterium]|nr:cysteine synthase family protein [Gammaproteobacteria bacterium]